MRRLGPVLPVVLLLAVMPAPAAAQDPAPADAVDAAAQVTANPATARAHVVPSVAVHPGDLRTVAVGEGDAYSGACAVHVSTDAGLTWTPRPLPRIDGFPNCLYAAFGSVVDVAFGTDGVLYAVYAANDPTTYRSRIHLARSTDLGATWSTTAAPWVEPDLDAGQFGADALPSVAVDPSDPQRVYVGWVSNNATWNHSEELLGGAEYFTDVFGRAYAAASGDGGASFGPAIDLGGDVAGYLTEPSLAVASDGTVHALFGDYTGGADASPQGEPTRVHHAWSGDGGATYTTAVVHQQSNPTDESNWLSAVAVAAGPDGSVYAVWEEMGTEPTSVMFARSAGRDADWSAPIVVNDVAAGRAWLFNEMFPSLAVAPGGRIDVAWYDWRDDPTFDPSAEEPANVLQTVYAASSDDGGQTFGTDVAVSDRLIDRRLGVAQAFGVAGPVGIAATDDATFIAWDDTRNSSEQTQSQDVYFTRIRHAPAAAVFGAGGADPVAWGLGGFGLALGLAGAVLVVLGVRRSRRAGSPGVPAGRVA